MKMWVQKPFQVSVFTLFEKFPEVELLNLVNITLNNSFTACICTLK